MTVSTDLAVTFTSMASDIKIRVVDPARGAREAVDRAVAEIDAIATHLTRFDPESALSKANRAPDAWHEVPAVLADAISAAHSAHRVTRGLFDPRVGSILAAWGYDKSFERIQTEAGIRVRAATRRAAVLGSVIGVVSVLGVFLAGPLRCGGGSSRGRRRGLSRGSRPGHLCSGKCGLRGRRCDLLLRQL